MTQIAFLLLVLGLAFLIIELCIPGFGVFGILGIIFTAVSFYITVIYVPMGLLIILVELIILLFLLYILFRFIKGRQNKDSLILYDTLQHRKEEPMDLSLLIGKEAITTTSLRPAGYIELNHVDIEVRTKSEYLPPKTKVRITGLAGDVLYVEKLTNNN